MLSIVFHVVRSTFIVPRSSFIVHRSSFIVIWAPGSRCSPSLCYGAGCSLGPAPQSGLVWPPFGRPRSHLRSKWFARYKCALSTFVFASQNHFTHAALVHLGLGFLLVLPPRGK
jgi:hypothetical protein